jgi:hypothetical protein
MAHSGHAARLDSDDVALHLDDRASYLAALPVLHADGPTPRDRTACLSSDDGSTPPRWPCSVRSLRPCVWRGKPRGWKRGTPLVSNCTLTALASCGDDFSLYAIFYHKKCDVITESH